MISQFVAGRVLITKSCKHLDVLFFTTIKFLLCKRYTQILGLSSAFKKNITCDLSRRVLSPSMQTPERRNHSLPAVKRLQLYQRKMDQESPEIANISKSNQIKDQRIILTRTVRTGAGRWGWAADARKFF